MKSIFRKLPLVICCALLSPLFLHAQQSDTSSYFPLGLWGIWHDKTKPPFTRALNASEWQKERDNWNGIKGNYLVYWIPSSVEDTVMNFCDANNYRMDIANYDYVTSGSWANSLGGWLYNGNYTDTATAITRINNLKNHFQSHSGFFSYSFGQEGPVYYSQLWPGVEFLSRKIHELDPQRKSYTLYGIPPVAFLNATPHLDIYEYETYPFDGNTLSTYSSQQSVFDNLASWFNTMKGLFQGRHTEWHFLMQAHRETRVSPPDLRRPNFFELRAQAYLSLSRGARGITSFVYGSGDDPSFAYYHGLVDGNRDKYTQSTDPDGLPGFDNLASVHEEIKKIGPILRKLRVYEAFSNTAIPSNAVGVTAVSGDKIEIGTFKRIDTGTDSTKYFMLVNRVCNNQDGTISSPQTIAVTFSSSTNQEISDVVSGNTWIIAPNGNFADILQPGSGKLYKIVPAVYNATRTIPSGTTLTVNAGATVKFAQYASLNVYGKLIVNGSSSQTATFTSSSTGSNWYGIVLSGSGANNSQLTYGTINNVLSYGGSALSVSGATGVVIDHCTITNNVNYGTSGIGLSNAGSPNISYNTITNNGGYGISYYNTSGDVWKNTIQNNPYGGIRLSNASPNFGHSGFYAYYGNNVITGGSYGIYADYYSYPYVGSQYNTYYGYNSIYNNSTKRVRASLSDVLAEQNWWGSSSPSSSWFEAVNNSIIEYYPWLYSPPGQQSSSLASVKGSSEPTVTSATTIDTMVNECWNAREAMLVGEPERAAEILSTTIKESKDSELIERTVAEFVTLMQLYPDNKNVQTIASVFKNKTYQSDIAKIHLARLYSISGDRSKALQLYQNAKGSDFTKTEYKLAGLNEFYENLLSDNVVSARQSLDDLQKYFAKDTEVKEATWLYEITKNKSGMNKNGYNDGNVQATTTDVISKGRLENYPNPFNPTTTIAFSLPEAGNARLVIYDYLGREVSVLVNGYTQSGEHEVQFNATSLASGIYFYSIHLNNFHIVRKMLLIK